MKCPRCGNEVSLEEAFCGQCGTPNAAPQALPTEMVHTPPPRSVPMNPYANNGNVGTQQPYGIPPSSNPQGVSFPPSVPLSPQSISPSPSSKQTGFYRDATEAMSVLPSNPNAGYPQQFPYPTTPPSGAYPPQGTLYGSPGQPSQVPPVQMGSYTGQGYPPVGGQAYRGVPVAPQKQRNGVVIFIVSICLVIALLSVVGVATLYIVKGRNGTPKDTQTQGVVPTATTLVPTPTTANDPTPTATVAPTDTVVPTATTLPTATPVTGFAYCGQACVTNGFSTQYPIGWSATPLTSTQGVQFVNPVAPDQTATFKTPGATAGAPSDLVESDLQQNFVNQSGYAVVTSQGTGYIGGETWFKEVITYMGATQQKEHVEVYANVHQGKAYILELQASEDQFAATSSYFTTIMNQFQYQ